MSSLTSKLNFEETKHENRGRRHFQQAHRKTSLFGSEHEEQTEMTKYEDGPSNGYIEGSSIAYKRNNPTSIAKNNGLSTSNGNTTHNGTEQNGNGADKEINLLIEAAKARAHQRELNKNERRSSLLDDSNFTETTSTYHKKRVTLKAPWHTDTNENNVIKNGNQNKRTQSSPIQTHSLMNKSTSQADFPEYSISELKESRPQQKRLEHKESIAWYPESVGINEQGDKYTPYKRSSDVIGESFMNVFGTENNLTRDENLKAKSENPTAVAMSSMHNTPYAHHN